MAGGTNLVGREALAGGGELLLELRIHAEEGTSPLGARLVVPWLDFPSVEPGATVIAASFLGRVVSEAPAARTIAAGDVDELEVTWPDGAVSTVALG